MAYKRPVSALIVIYAQDTGRVLMLQRRDDPDFWQSVTGRLQDSETAALTAQREVKEEVNIDIAAEGLSLFDCQRCVEFELFAHLRRRYAPSITHNMEHWFCLALPSEREVILTDHLAYRWLAAPEAARLTKSWSNRQSIEEFIIYPA
ncbi:dihydroneopterin triphosphate diphosphatase [BEV proteobacterium]|nr:dihydroneopterin triphosphate diphosphatase [Candidatus Symbiopectobacterium sp. Chty_BC]